MSCPVIMVNCLVLSGCAAAISIRCIVPLVGLAVRVAIALPPLLLCQESDLQGATGGQGKQA